MKDTINPDCLNYSEVLSVYSTKKAAEEDIKKLIPKYWKNELYIIRREMKI